MDNLINNFLDELKKHNVHLVGVAFFLSDGSKRPVVSNDLSRENLKTAWRLLSEVSIHNDGDFSKIKSHLYKLHFGNKDGMGWD